MDSIPDVDRLIFQPVNIFEWSPLVFGAVAVIPIVIVLHEQLMARFTHWALNYPRRTLFLSISSMWGMVLVVMSVAYGLHSQPGNSNDETLGKWQVVVIKWLFIAGGASGLLFPFFVLPPRKPHVVDLDQSSEGVMTGVGDAVDDFRSRSPIFKVFLLAMNVLHSLVSVMLVVLALKTTGAYMPSAGRWINAVCIGWAYWIVMGFFMHMSRLRTVKSMPVVDLKNMASSSHILNDSKVEEEEVEFGSLDTYLSNYFFYSIRSSKCLGNHRPIIASCRHCLKYRILESRVYLVFYLVAAVSLILGIATLMTMVVVDDILMMYSRGAQSVPSCLVALGLLLMVIYVLFKQMRMHLITQPTAAPLEKYAKLQKSIVSIDIPSSNASKDGESKFSLNQSMGSVDRLNSSAPQSSSNTMRATSMQGYQNSLPPLASIKEKGVPPLVPNAKQVFKPQVSASEPVSPMRSNNSQPASIASPKSAATDGAAYRAVKGAEIYTSDPTVATLVQKSAPVSAEGSTVTSPVSAVSNSNTMRPAMTQKIRLSEIASKPRAEEEKSKEFGPVNSPSIESNMSKVTKLQSMLRLSLEDVETPAPASASTSPINAAPSIAESEQHLDPDHFVITSKVMTDLLLWMQSPACLDSTKSIFTVSDSRMVVSVQANLQQLQKLMTTYGRTVFPHLVRCVRKPGDSLGENVACPSRFDINASQYYQSEEAERVFMKIITKYYDKNAVFWGDLSEMAEIKKFVLVMVLVMKQKVGSSLP